MVARKTRLRAVPPNARKKLTLTQSVSRMNHRAALKAMAEKLAAAIESADCPPTALAALSKRLADTLAEIESIDRRAKVERSDSDDAAELDTSWKEGEI